MPGLVRSGRAERGGSLSSDGGSSHFGYAVDFLSRQGGGGHSAGWRMLGLVCPGHAGRVGSAPIDEGFSHLGRGVLVARVLLVLTLKKRRKITPLFGVGFSRFGHGVLVVGVLIVNRWR